MWPIKWKEILYRITIWNQKMSQYNSLESALQIGLIFFYFEDYSKSARGMILFLLVTCSYIPILLKNAEKPTVIWLSTENFFKSTVLIEVLLRTLTSLFLLLYPILFIIMRWICEEMKKSALKSCLKIFALHAFHFIRTWIFEVSLSVLIFNLVFRLKCS